ncbi:MAG: histidine kinase [Methylophilaceae bacterium]|nr:MAG: histidine kinase [Methylophilaceae bacterium]
MLIRYPNSFLTLLLIGFAFAIFPLLWAFTNANIAFGDLAKQSEATISQAVETTRLSRALQEKSSLMERSARQYFVLKDAILFKSYQQAHTEFDRTTVNLFSHLNNQSLKEKLTALQESTGLLHESIVTTKKNYTDDLSFLDAFNQQTQQIDQIIQENNDAIDMASSQLTTKAKKTQRNLFLQSLVLIPLALLVAGIIAFLLARPIRRMDSAIRNLGEGHYETPISIDGPGDLRILGRRLDWLRTELKDVNAQKQQFLRHVSHELKTPLTAIREATELLRDGIGGALSAQQTEIIQIMRDNSIRLQKMIENLLNYTKIESSQSQSTLQSLDLAAVINKVLNAHALSISNKKLVVDVDSNVDENLSSNEEKLSIILDNLISNAVNYTPESGRINITTNTDSDWFIIEVQDNGPGLAKEDFEKVFDPFYRGNTAHNGLINGSGLGLTIVKDIVQTLDGKINLLPSKQGAHFSVRLPKNNANTTEI